VGKKVIVGVYAEVHNHMGMESKQTMKTIHL